MDIIRILEDVVQNGDDVDGFIQSHGTQLLGTHRLHDVYRVLKSYKSSDSQTIVIQAWLALLNGDNLLLSTLSSQVDEDDLNDDTLGLFYDLHALSGVFATPKERLAKSKQAIAVLEDASNRFFLANAYLTRGQLYVGFEEFGLAAESLQKAYQLFMAEQAIFPAVVAMTNRLLNLFRLGRFNDIFQQANQVMMMASVKEGLQKSYFDVIRLPLGMVHAIKGSYRLAITELQKAYHAINELDLIHMHGYVEIYLFLCYTVTKNNGALNKLRQDTSKIFRNMNYPMMQVIQLYGKVLANEDLDQSEIETIQVYQDNQQELHDPLIFELSFYVFLKGYQKHTSIDYYIDGLKHYRYIGDVVHLSQSILFLAEYYIQQQDTASCKTVLEEFITLYHTYGIQAPLDSYQYHFYDLLVQLDPDIPVPITKKQLLTDKEMEVLRYIQQGLTNKEIAKELYISPGTVKWHTTNIYSKLDVSSRLAAVQKAIELDYL